MPFPNYHSARVTSPDEYDSMRTATVDSGILVIYGIKDGESEIQSYRFDKDKFSESDARAWLEGRDVKFTLFERSVETGKRAAVKLDTMQIVEFNIGKKGAVLNPHEELYISGVATTTGISNGHRFPAEFLAKDTTLVGKPILDNHSGFPWGNANSDFLGRVDGTEWEEQGVYEDGLLKGERRGRLLFHGRIWDAQAKRVIEEFPEARKFSVAWEHTSEIEILHDVDEDGEEVDVQIRKTRTGTFDHLGLLSNPADKDAVLTSFKGETMDDEAPNTTPEQDDAPVEDAVEELEEVVVEEVPDNDVVEGDENEVEEEAAEEEAEPVEDVEETPDEEPADEPDDAPEESEDDGKSDDGDENLAMSEAKATAEAKVVELEAEVTELKARVAELEADAAAEEEAKRVANVTDYVTALAKSGVVPPKMQDETVKHYLGMTEDQFSAEQKLNEARGATVDMSAFTEEKGKTPGPSSKGNAKRADTKLT